MPQAAHAVTQFIMDYPERAREWFRMSNTLVILATKDEQSLHKLTEKLDNYGLKYSKFYEPDVGHALTAIAIVPSPHAKRFCSNLPLAGKARSGE